MKAKPPSVRPTGTREHDVFQRETREAIVEILRDPLLDFSVRRSVAVLASPTQIAHGLGRVPTGWQLTDITGDARVWRTAWDDEYVTLQASAPVTVSIRFH